MTTYGRARRVCRADPRVLLEVSRLVGEAERTLDRTLAAGSLDPAATPWPGAAGRAHRRALAYHREVLATARSDLASGRRGIADYALDLMAANRTAELGALRVRWSGAELAWLQAALARRALPPAVTVGRLLDRWRRALEVRATGLRQLRRAVEEEREATDRLVARTTPAGQQLAGPGTARPGGGGSAGRSRQLAAGWSEATT